MDTESIGIKLLQLPSTTNTARSPTVAPLSKSIRVNLLGCPNSSESLFSLFSEPLCLGVIGSVWIKVLGFLNEYLCRINVLSKGMLAI